MSTEKCPVCDADNVDYSSTSGMSFYSCPVCGRFELSWIDKLHGFNQNHLASYFFYHNFGGFRYHTVRSKEICDKHNDEFNKGNNVAGQPMYLNSDIVESWYPKTFAERIDKILLYLVAHTLHMGQSLHFSYYAVLSLLFIDRLEIDDNPILGRNQWTREKEDCLKEAQYALEYLQNSSLIKYDTSGIGDSCVTITVMPKGYNRVEEIQKNPSYGRDVFVAMQFGKDTEILREAIKQGVTEAGYNPLLIDEIPYNGFIAPEILKQIKDCRFMVVDLSNENRGAYFEEGYAMGLGKDIIQICKKDVKLHFDIAQINTIMWETEAEIPQKLKNRIIATID